MTSVNLPTTATATTTATTVTIIGHHSEVCVRNLGTVPVWVRGDGQTAVAKADYNWCVPPYQGNDIEIPSAPATGALGSDGNSPTTTLSVITASGTADLFLFADED